jgi:hypothetical protein
MASVAELKKSFFAEIDKIENREDLEKGFFLGPGGILVLHLAGYVGNPEAAFSAGPRCGPDKS